MSTPRRKNKVSASDKRASPQGKAARGVVNNYIVSGDDTGALKPDDLDDIHKIFKLGLGAYVSAEDHTKSTSTRKPAFYDKHLDARLRPTKVAYCPDIPAQLTSVAASRYEEYKGKLGLPSECEETKFSNVRNKLQAKKVVRAERGVLLGYAETMGKTLLPIVSALAFQVPSWKQRYLEWTTEQNQDKAIPDASLRVNLGILPEEDASHDCPYSSLGRKRRRSASQCRICNNPYPEELKNVARYFANIVLHESKSLVSGTLQHFIALLEQTRYDEVCWEECDEKSCSHPRINPPVSGSPTGFDAKNPIVRLVAEDWGKTVVGRSSQTTDALDVNHRVSAKYMIQQIWSEMVKNDATFLVLNSGNFEIIALRNRENRILYLSDIIVTTDPGYFGIHVGLFIAAIQDAIDRAERLKTSEEIDAIPCSWTDYVGYLRVNTPCMETGPTEVEEILSDCQKLCLVPPKGADAIPYRRWNLYERSPKEQLEASYSVVIRTRASDDWNICIGTVEHSGKVFEDSIIVKIARGKYATRVLSMEYSVYRSLGEDSQKCKIPGMYGFFVDLSDEDEPHAVLLLEHVGKPWYQCSPGQLSKDQWKSVNMTRDYMHKRRYEYGKIDEKSVVIAPGEDDIESDVFLVGLSKCVRASAEKKTGQRLAKRPKNRGTAIHLGPVSNATSSATRAFKQITAWTKNMQGAALPPSARCLGWVDNLPDWLEIAVSEEDAEKFEELWKCRDTLLRKIECIIYR